MKKITKRSVVLGLAVIVSFLMIYQASELCLAWWWGRSSELRLQIRGAQLVAGNAEAWDRIGEALQANFDNGDPREAVQYFERAVRVNPDSASDWMDLAQACEASGDTLQARTAYERAQRDYPISAEVHWKYGNFLLRQGQTSAGFEEVHSALLADPKLIPLAISRIWNFDPDVQVILTKVLPQEEQAQQEALDFFAAKHEDSAALETWKKLKNSNYAISIGAVFAFIDELITSNRAADAKQVWEEAIKASHWPTPDAVEDSQIWNGGFEAPIVNGGLGWRFEQESGAYISTDSYVHHSGQKSLRVDFTGGSNLDFKNVHQFVPVEPRTHYVFQCFMRTESLSTESGLRFEIQEPNHYQVSVTTSDLTGTKAWTPVRADVITGPNTHFLDIRLRRLPSRLFDNKLSGTVWVDDVSLIQVPLTGAEPHP